MPAFSNPVTFCLKSCILTQARSSNKNNAISYYRADKKKPIPEIFFIKRPLTIVHYSKTYRGWLNQMPPIPSVNCFMKLVSTLFLFIQSLIQNFFIYGEFNSSKISSCFSFPPTALHLAPSFIPIH